MKDPVERHTGICKFAGAPKRLRLRANHGKSLLVMVSADAVAGEEHVMSRPEFHGELVDLAGDKGLRLLQGVPAGGAQATLGYPERPPSG